MSVNGVDKPLAGADMARQVAPFSDARQVKALSAREHLEAHRFAQDDAAKKIRRTPDRHQSGRSTCAAPDAPFA